MATASLHARQRRRAATEAGLWLIWITARITGLAHLARRTARLTRAAADSDAAHWLAATGNDLWQATHTAVHRQVLRAELAAADWLTGPAPQLLDTATARLRLRAGWLLLAGVAVANVILLAAR